MSDLLTQLPMIAQATNMVAQLGSWAIIGLVIGGIIAILLVVLRQNGVSIPSWIITILWILVAVALGVGAIKFLVTLL